MTSSKLCGAPKNQSGRSTLLGAPDAFVGSLHPGWARRLLHIPKALGELEIEPYDVPNHVRRGHMHLSNNFY
jgi:hypothetical protein